MDDVENYMVKPHADDDLKPVSEREAQLLDRIEELEQERNELRDNLEALSDERDEWRSMFKQASLQYDQLYAIAKGTNDDMRALIDKLKAIVGKQA